MNGGRGAIEGVAVLSVTEPARALARGFLEAAAMPSKAVIDAAHVAIEAVCRAAGFRPPVICTPLELRVEDDQ